MAGTAWRSASARFPNSLTPPGPKGEGKLTILAAGQHRVVHESKEALELLQWLYAHRDVFLSTAYPAGAPDWAQEGKTSLHDTDPHGLKWDEDYCKNL